MRIFYTVIYRRGGNHNFKWCHTLLAGSFEECRQMCLAISKAGYACYIDIYIWECLKSNYRKRIMPQYHSKSTITE